MSDPTSIFQNSPNGQTPSGETNAPASNGAPPQANQLDTMLASIRNENGEQKYRTVEDAIKALAHSQSYIPQLRTELDSTKAALAAAQAERDRIAELERTVQQLTQNNSPAATPPAGLSEEQVALLVTKTLTQTQQAQIQKENLNSVVEAVKKSFGDKAEEVFYSKAKELGMSVEEVNALAAKTPKAVLTLLGVSTAPEMNRSAPSSGLNSNAFQGNPAGTIGINTKPIMLGSTTDELRQEGAASRKMVEELHAMGLDTYALTDPKMYRKYFGK